MILKYNPDEARNLKTYGELPENAKLNEGGEEMEDGGIEFGSFSFFNSLHFITCFPYKDSVGGCVGRSLS